MVLYNFQCRGVLLIWITGEPGSALFSADAECFIIIITTLFTLKFICHILFFFFPPYNVKYNLIGP